MKTFRIIFLIASLVFLTSNSLAQSTYISKLPVKPGKGVTITGIVECDGKPVAGVSVSDGYDITLTDKKGAYYLKSRKQNPQVFISSPSGYDIYRDDIVPQFWAELTLPADKLERHDFRLTKNENNKHFIILTTDMHLHGKRSDLKTFARYMDVINREYGNLAKEGNPVYSIGLGDISYDNYWYETGVDIEKTREILNQNKWPMLFYNIMGNHDSDGGVCVGDSTDFLSAFRFMRTYGPRYYSHNIGKVHYIFLDNIVFLNDKSSQPQNEGIKGKRNYKEMLTPDQLDWLAKDLKNLPDETPIIVSMHAPLHLYKKNSTDVYIKPDAESSAKLKEMLRRFKNVHYLSGHTHKNSVVRTEDGDCKITDYNLLSTCGSIWWNNSFNQKNLAHDGNPVGFAVMNIDGDDITYRFIPYEYPRDRQFKVWDVNSLKQYFSKDNEVQTFLRHLPKWGTYKHLPANSVLIQVWNWDPAGNLSVSENGKPMDAKCVWEVHPDYYSMTAIQKAEWVGDYKKGLREPRRARMFLVETGSVDTPLEITYTDAFGNTDTRTFTRPHPYDSNPSPSSED